MSRHQSPRRISGEIAQPVRPTILGALLFAALATLPFAIALIALELIWAFRS